jgi:hypothetical protein
VSKASRRQQRLARQPGSTGPATGGSAASGSSTGGVPSSATGSRPTSTTTSSGSKPSTSPTGTPRAGRRAHPRSYRREQSFVERYRGLIVAVAALAGVALIGGVIFLQATAKAYACSNEWVPTPTPSPAAGASPQIGYLQPDMGRRHVTVGDVVTYTYCPPASGNHYFASGQGPIAPRMYGPNDVTEPQGWVHNLEHGALVLLYRGDGPGGTADGQAALRKFFDTFPPTPVCGIAAGTNVSPVIARFDDMAAPFTALVWGRALPLQTFDPDEILAFYQEWGEKTNPEPQCAGPSPSAEPSGSPSAAPSASPSSAPPSAAPSSSAGASAAPSASASPS